MNVTFWCTRVIRWSFYLLFTLVPLILTPWNYELFEFNKMMVTYIITAIIATSWIIKMIHERQIRITKTPLDIPIGIFFASQLISSIFSMDPHVSWMGYYSRFNGGMWSVISYIVLYFAFVSNIKKDSIPGFIRVIVGSSVVVAIYGFAERLGIDKHLWVQDVQTRVFSTLGQPNWLAAYIVALLPTTIMYSLLYQPVTAGKKFVLNTTFIKHAALTLTSILLFFVLLCTRSRSGLFAFAVVDVLIWISTVLFIKPKKNPLITLAIIHVVFAVIIFFNGSYISQIDTYFTFNGIRQTLVTKQTAKAEATPSAGYTGPVLETGGTESGVIRKYVWEGAINAWKNSPKNMIIGTGTETFAFAFYRFRPAGHNLTSEWDFLYNKAHNEYLNYLATTGVLGLGSYLLFLGVCIGWCIKSQIKKSDMVARALFIGWISILITNFFGFSVVVIQLFLFLFPALILILSQEEKQPAYQKTISFSLPVKPVSIGTLIVGMTLLIILATQWYADTLFASSYRLARSGQYAKAQTLIEQATMLYPAEPIYKDEMSTTLIALAVGAFSEQNATIGGELANRSLIENSSAIKISPQNVNYWKTRTKIYYSLSTYDPKLNADAIASLEQAMILSPNDPKLYYNLAILYGRQSENEKAITFLEKAHELKPNYRDVYYALYIFYSEMKNLPKAKAMIQEYLATVDPTDAQFLEIQAKLK